MAELSPEGGGASSPGRSDAGDAGAEAPDYLS